ncbi:hypothetical protein EMWEY_00058260, partial [Eimeria maxima]
MEVSWLPKEKPVTWHQTTSQSYLDLPAAPHGKDVKDATSCTGYSPCISSRPRKGLPLVAALATVSAVIFLAYLCSLSIRGRLSKRLFVRKLAGGENAKENNETDPCVPHSDTDIDALPGTPEQPSEGRNPSAHGLLRYPSWSGESGTAYRIPVSLMGASAAPVEGLYRAARPHLGPAEEKRGEKRKERETDGVGRGAKVQKLEAPIHHSLLGPSVPHLDPALDSLIDFTLSEGARVLYGNMWLLDDVASPYVVPSILESEDTTPAEMYVGQQSHGAPMPASTISTPLLPGNLSTLDSSDPPAMSPLSFFESVLSEASQSTPGLYADDWLLSGDAEVVREALGLIDSRATPSMLLGSRGESQKGAGPRAKVLSGATESQMYVGAPSCSKISERDTHLETVQEPADVSSGMPSTSTDPESGRAAGVLESTSLRSLLPRSSTGSTQSSPGEDSHAAQLVLASQAQAAADNLVASRGWLKKMMMGVSEQLLRTHPFYRLPEVEPLLSGRRFNNLREDEYRPKDQKLIWLLSKCRKLLTKERLTTSELEVLLEKTEQLYRYATGPMPTYKNTRPAVEILGRVFMVLDTLYCALEVLGNNARRADLWPAVVHHIQNAGYHGDSKRPVLGKTYSSSSV